MFDIVNAQAQFMYVELIEMRLVARAILVLTLTLTFALGLILTHTHSRNRTCSPILELNNIQWESHGALHNRNQSFIELVS